MISSVDWIMKRLRGNYIDLLIALDENGSLRKAAQQVSLSQPATTKALHEIEYMVGAELFTRSPRGMVANEFGRCMIRHARLMRSNVGNLCAELANLVRGGGGSLVIGAVMEALPVWVTPALQALRRCKADIRVQVLEDHSVRLLPMLDQRLLDLAICRMQVGLNAEFYDFLPLDVEELCFVVDGSHPLARARKLEFAQIACNPWVVPPPHLATRLLLEQFFHDAGFAFPRDAIEAASTFTMLSLLRAGDGTICMLPKSVAKTFAPSGCLSILPIEFGITGVPYGIVTRKGTAISQPAQMFIEICKKRLLAGAAVTLPAYTEEERRVHDEVI